MRQLTSLDAQFLALETDTADRPRRRRSRSSTPRPRRAATLDLQGHLQELIAERLPLLPPLRWRLAEVPFGLDYPYWVDDPDFDLDFHVRELALPAPGSDDKLAEQVARIVARPLDRARPLWELYLISRPRGRSRGPAHQDPPRGDRRPLRRRDHGRALRPRPGGPRAAASRLRTAPTGSPASSRCSPGADGISALSAAHPALAADELCRTSTSLRCSRASRVRAWWRRSPIGSPGRSATARAGSWRTRPTRPRRRASTVVSLRTAASPSASSRSRT